jgi:hypothetical protein
LELNIPQMMLEAYDCKKPSIEWREGEISEAKPWRFAPVIIDGGKEQREGEKFSRYGKYLFLIVHIKLRLSRWVNYTLVTLV